jgi:hypothetical protein
VLIAAAILLPFGPFGCGSYNPLRWPFSMGIFTPVPVPPWVTERMEEKYIGKNDFRTTIMPPIREGFPPPLCEDPPDDAMVLRALDNVARGVPYFYEEFRDDIQVVTERLVDRIDPPRFFPLVGPAQLHHCHWKCTVYFTETVESGYPFPVRLRRPRVKVVYIDKDHLHLYPCGNQATQQEVARDLIGP